MLNPKLTDNVSEGACFEVAPLLVY
jgi:hypothetical protein